jgi:hypothetical protein
MVRAKIVRAREEDVAMMASLVAQVSAQTRRCDGDAGG